MSVTVAMYDKAYEQMRARLDALGLDLVVHTFCKDGTYSVQGRATAPADVAVDYLWLSTHIGADKFQEGAFKLALATGKVGVLQTFNAGLDHPFYKAIAAKGTRLLNSSAQAVAISEYVFGQVMAVLQPIEQQRALQAAKEWKVTPYREIAGSNWLIVGFGPIGQEIAKRAKAFGASTAVVRRKPATGPLVDRAGSLADVGRLAADADVIVLACPLNAETRGFAGPAFFTTVKPGAILVNIARGGLIDDAAMIAALDSGQLATAVLDVFHEEPLPAANPLWSHPKVRMTSHTSFAGSGVRGRWERLFLDNIARFVKGEALANEVDPRDLA